MKLKEQLVKNQQQSESLSHVRGEDSTYVTNCSWQIGNTAGSWPLAEVAATELPATLRRRLSPMGRKVVGMLYGILSPLTIQGIPWVVSCRHGDTARMVNLLTSLARKELMSPTDFSMSVHNAAIGTFSIATGNQKMHTSLSGGAATFEAGLLEAFALQKEQKNTVGYLYYDDPLPQHYEEIFEEDRLELCTVVILDNHERESSFKGESRALSIDFVRDDKGLLDEDVKGVIPFLKFVQSNEKNYSIHVPGGAIILGCP